MLIPRESCFRRALKLLVIVVLTLLPSKPELGDCVTVYNWKWVLHQLEYD